VLKIAILCRKQLLLLLPSNERLTIAMFHETRITDLRLALLLQRTGGQELLPLALSVQHLLLLHI